MTARLVMDWSWVGAARSRTMQASHHSLPRLMHTHPASGPAACAAVACPPLHAAAPFADSDLAPLQDSEAEARERRLLAHLAHVAHELRSPLHGLVGLARLTASEAELSPKHRRWLDSIAQCGEHLSRTVNDLLEVGLASSAEVTLRPQPLRLSALLNGLAELARAEVRNPSVLVRTQLQGGHPTADPVLWVDGQRLRQLLLNLLGNAARATAEGSISLNCHRVGPARWCFEVADTGHGMDADQLAELLRQGHALELWSHGSPERRGGLGLVISRRLAQALGGELAVRGTPGGGNTFWFEIDAPAAPSAA